MTGDDDTVGSQVKTPISLVMSRVSQEDTESRTRGEFVRSGGGKVRVTLATKHPRVIIRGMGAVRSKVWGGKGQGFGG